MQNISYYSFTKDFKTPEKTPLRANFDFLDSDSGTGLIHLPKWFRIHNIGL